MARKIWRRKGTLVGVTVIGTIIAALILFQLTPKYTSTATVMIDPRESKVLDVQAVLSGMPADQETIESEIEVLLSRRLAERVIQKLALYRSPEFNARLRPVSGTQKMLRALNPKSLIPDSMLEWMNLASTGPGLTEEQILEKERIGIIDEHLDKLAVKRVGRSRVIAISVTLANPALAAAVANAVADLYIVEQLEAKFEATRRATEWLNDRLAGLRDAVQKSSTCGERSVPRSTRSCRDCGTKWPWRGRAKTRWPVTCGAWNPASRVSTSARSSSVRCSARRPRTARCTRPF